MQLIERINAYGEKTPGLSQYAIRKYGEAFEVVPRTLAESAGLDATEMISRLYTKHGSGQRGKQSEDWTMGVDIENEDGTGILDAEDEGILDLLNTKESAIKLATDAARTVLGIDQIIVARQAGGPSMKPPAGQDWDED